MPRGGRRAGGPGAYPNRSDLSAQKSLPVRTATGQTYGRALEQQNAQRTVPMAPPPSPVAQPGQASLPMPANPSPQAAAQPFSPGAAAPGSAGPLNRPSERPGEPVTTGAPIGAGAGPEALPQMPTNPGQGGMSDILRQIAAASGSQAIAELAQRAASLGQ